MRCLIRWNVLGVSLLGLLTALGACGTTTETTVDAVADGTDLDGAETLSDAVSPTDSQTADLPDANTDVAAPDLQALCLEGVPNPVVFAPTPSGSAAMATFKVKNCGLQGVCITGVDLQNETAYLGEYNLTMKGMETLCPGTDPTKGPSVTKPCCLAKGSEVSLELYFTPKYYAAAKKTAQVWLNSNAGKTIVLLEGIATK